MNAIKFQLRLLLVGIVCTILTIFLTACELPECPPGETIITEHTAHIAKKIKPHTKYSVIKPHWRTAYELEIELDNVETHYTVKVNQATYYNYNEGDIISLCEEVCKSYNIFDGYYYYRKFYSEDWEIYFTASL